MCYERNLDAAAVPGRADRRGRPSVSTQLQAGPAARTIVLGRALVAPEAEFQRLKGELVAQVSVISTRNLGSRSLTISDSHESYRQIQIQFDALETLHYQTVASVFRSPSRHDRVRQCHGKHAIFL